MIGKLVTIRAFDVGSPTSVFVLRNFVSCHATQPQHFLAVLHVSAQAAGGAGDETKASASDGEDTPGSPFDELFSRELTGIRARLAELDARHMMEAGMKVRSTANCCPCSC